MAYVKNIFDKNFIEYASYVVRDRAIPAIEDGFKPVQRRIMQTLIDMDNGLMHKVAKVVGQVMNYHPHGDASIGGALVVLANKEYFIERQGNYGNIFTGDEAAATRYIECRLLPLAKDILYNPNITKFVDSYDGRSKEPVVFRAKLPLVLITAAEGIAVGMNTKIMPHNILEVIDAEKKCLLGEPFVLYPDFPTGGLVDLTDYKDGLGKIITRAKFDLSDERKIMITELPYPSNSESLTASITNAAKNGKIKISSVTDYSSDHAAIEVSLPRGTRAKDVADSLYAFTDCEQSVSCNLLVIKDNMPVQMTVSEVIKYHANQLQGILKDELEFERASLMEKLHLRTLERIFIEERIYKSIEEMKTQEAVNKAVISGFEPFKSELVRAITKDDVEHLLSIPIRRISLYDINKNRQEVQAINKRLKEIAKLLKNLVAYAVSYLDAMSEKIKKLESESKEKTKLSNPNAVFFDFNTNRKTKVMKFNSIDVKEIVRSDLSLRYDDKGYLGKNVSGGEEVMKVSPYDRILVVRKNGLYSAFDVPDKMFIDKGMVFCQKAEKEIISKTLFTVIFRDEKTKIASIKRCRIPSWILNRDYFLAPEGTEVLHVDTREDFSFTLLYEKKPRMKVLEESFRASDFEEKGPKTLGVRLSQKETAGIVVDGK
ncbi:MAG: DNA topoisomerase IV subunit A [Treponema sp.]|nr:DNA topoisomerase IV subunit A [Treponema sp.]